MNGWGITGLVLLFLALLILVIRFYVERTRYKAEWAGLHKQIDDLTSERDTVRSERDALQKQLDKEHETLEERGKLKEQVHTYITANTKILNDYQLLLTERNALQKVHEAELEKYRKYFEGLKEDLKKANEAMLSLSNECDALRLQLDEALRPKSPPPSDGTRKPRMKTKPTSMEPPSTV